MNILLVNETDHLSSGIYHRALSNGNIVHVLNREGRKTILDNISRVIQADFQTEREQEIRKKLSNVCYDAIVDFTVSDSRELKKHIDSFRDCCRQYVLISSAAVYEPDTAEEVITEETRTGNVTWEYARKKLECEVFLRKHIRDYDMTYTIVRPYFTYSHMKIPFALNSMRSSWTLANRILMEKPIVLWDDGIQEIPLTSAAEFAVGVTGLLGNEKAYGETFHITSGAAQSWKEILVKISEAVGRNAITVNIPADYIADRMPEYRGILLTNRGRRMTFDNSKIRSVVPEYRNRITFEDSIRETVQYMRKHRELQTVDEEWDTEIDRVIMEYKGKEQFDRKWFRSSAKRGKWRPDFLRN